MNFETELKLVMSLPNSLIYITTEEEDRLEYTINYISKKKFKQTIHKWNFIDGYTDNLTETENAIKNPLKALDIIQNINNKQSKIFFLKDFNLFMNDLSIIRKIKNLYIDIQQKNIYVFMIGIETEIPSILKEYISHMKFPRPNRSEIKVELKRLFQVMHIKNHISLNQLSIAYKGFSIQRIRKSIAKIIITQSKPYQIFDSILEEKKRFIEQNNIFDFYPHAQVLEDLGGLYNLKKWLKTRSYTFSKKAKNYGIPAPRGILLTGIQGTGKSLCAKTISKEWNLPLLKLDISKIFTSILGESEKNFQQMIDISEQIAPCILWIDEIDKIFTKNINHTDSGTTSRITNIFLTWLSEKTSSIFIVGTANSINNLPIEIIRKGRFDEIFFLDLPNCQERSQIFQIHLRKIRPLTWQKYNIDYLSRISLKFSGAEIRQVIIEAMHNAFYENREFNTSDIIRSIEAMIPLAFTDDVTISKLQLLSKAGKIRKA